MKKLITIFVCVIMCISLMSACEKPTKSPLPHINEQTFSDTSHKNSSVEIAYPDFSENGMEEINKSISDFAKSFADEYYGEDYEDLQLELNYNIECCNENILSVSFSGIGNVKTAAHPNNIFVTRNYDLKTGNLIKFSDIFVINEKLAEKFKTLAQEQLEKDFSDAFHLQYETNDEITEALLECDLNINESQSSFDGERVTVSFPVPHAVGDYLNVEIPLSELKEK